MVCVIKKMKKRKIEIEVFSNGCTVIIKSAKKIIGSKVFEGKDNIIRSIKYIEKICKVETKKQIKSTS